MAAHIQNRNLVYTTLNNLAQTHSPAELARPDIALSTPPPQQISDQSNSLQSDTTLARLLDAGFLDQLRRNTAVPANSKILHFAEWVQSSHPSADQLRTAKLHLIQDLMHTQRNWVSDTLQISAAVARTLGGVLMTGNSLSSEWEGLNQQAFESALFHLNDECESWTSRMGYLARGYRSGFDQMGEEANINDAALSLIRDLVREELRQTSATRNLIEHDYYKQLLRDEISEVSGTQQLASTLRSHSVLFARSSAEAATGVFGAFACFGALRIARALTQKTFAQTVLNGAFNGFLQVALQSSAHQGFASMFSKEFATQATQAFVTGAACGVSGSLVNAGFGRLLGNTALSTTSAAGDKVFRWATARLFQRGVTFATDIETEVRMDNALSGLSGRRNIHNRLAMGDQVETTAFWDRLVNSAGEFAGDHTTEAYSHSAQSAYEYVAPRTQEYGPKIIESVRQLFEDIFRGPPDQIQPAFAGISISNHDVESTEQPTTVNAVFMKGEGENEEAPPVPHHQTFTLTQEGASALEAALGINSAHIQESVLPLFEQGEKNYYRCELEGDYPYVLLIIPVRGHSHHLGAKIFYKGDMVLKEYEGNLSTPSSLKLIEEEEETFLLPSRRSIRNSEKLLTLCRALSEVELEATGVTSLRELLGVPEPMLDKRIQGWKEKLDALKNRSLPGSRTLQAAAPSVLEQAIMRVDSKSLDWHTKYAILLLLAESPQADGRVAALFDIPSIRQAAYQRITDSGFWTRNYLLNPFCIAVVTRVVDEITKLARLMDLAYPESDEANKLLHLAYDIFEQARVDRKPSLPENFVPLGLDLREYDLVIRATSSYFSPQIFRALQREDSERAMGYLRSIANREGEIFNLELYKIFWEQDPAAAETYLTRTTAQTQLEDLIDDTEGMSREMAVYIAKRFVEEKKYLAQNLTPEALAHLSCHLHESYTQHNIQKALLPLLLTHGEIDLAMELLRNMDFAVQIAEGISMITEALLGKGRKEDALSFLKEMNGVVAAGANKYNSTQQQRMVVLMKAALESAGVGARNTEAGSGVSALVPVILDEYTLLALVEVAFQKTSMTEQDLAHMSELEERIEILNSLISMYLRNGRRDELHRFLEKRIAQSFGEDLSRENLRDSIRRSWLMDAILLSGDQELLMQVADLLLKNPVENLEFLKNIVNYISRKRRGRA